MQGSQGQTVQPGAAQPPPLRKQQDHVVGVRFPSALLSEVSQTLHAQHQAASLLGLGARGGAASAAGSRVENPSPVDARSLAKAFTAPKVITDFFRKQEATVQPTVQLKPEGGVVITAAAGQQVKRRAQGSGAQKLAAGGGLRGTGQKPQHVFGIFPKAVPLPRCQAAATAAGTEAVVDLVSSEDEGEEAGAAREEGGAEAARDSRKRARPELSSAAGGQDDAQDLVRLQRAPPHMRTVPPAAAEDDDDDDLEIVDEDEVDGEEPGAACNPLAAPTAPGLVAAGPSPVAAAGIPPLAASAAPVPGAAGSCPLPASAAPSPGALMVPQPLSGLAAALSSRPRAPLPRTKREKMVMLADMGFVGKQAEQALFLAHDNVNRAVELCLAGEVRL